MNENDFIEISADEFEELVQKKSEEFFSKFLAEDLGEIISEDWSIEAGYDHLLYDAIIDRMYEFYKEAVEIEVLEDLAQEGKYA